MYKLLREIYSNGLRHPLLLPTKELLILRSIANSNNIRKASLSAVSYVF